MLNSVFGWAATQGAALRVPESLAALPVRIVDLFYEQKASEEAERQRVRIKLAGLPRVVRPPKQRGIATNSEGVSQSWMKPDIHKSRMTRHSVFVEGHGEFRSTVGAFKALGLPLEKCVRFRLIVKKELAGTFAHEGREYAFRIGEERLFARSTAGAP